MYLSRACARAGKRMRRARRCDLGGSSRTANARWRHIQPHTDVTSETLLDGHPLIASIVVLVYIQVSR